MPELDPFELRLTAAVQAMADGADTRVDAIAVAAGAIGHRRRWSLSFAGLPLPVPASILVLLALLLALFAWSMPAGAPRDHRNPAIPASSTVTPTASFSTDGAGDEYVTGTGAFSVVARGTSTAVGDVIEVRGFVAITRDAMDDPRITGTGTLEVSLDTRGAIGTEWGTYRLTTAEGAWAGTVSGASWSGGNESDVMGSLAGSGAYEGSTYYIHIRSVGTTTEIDGIIYPGLPPGP